MDEKLQTEPDDTPQKPQVAQKRKTGWGERIFNFSVYGGISWILNEVLATAITSTIYPSEVKPTDSLVAKVFKPNGLMQERFERAVLWLEKNANPMKLKHMPVWLAAEIFVMTIAGNVLVPFSKAAEDHKGKIVRAIDNVLTGGKGDADPGVKRAHEEMDAAPKQSWFSQVWGRLLVLTGAIIMQFTIGAEKEGKYVAPSTKLGKGTWFEKYSNLRRLMSTGTRDIYSRLPFIAQEEREAIKVNRARSILPDGNFLWIQKEEGEAAKLMGNTLGFVLSISAVVATLFFVSSHVIAAVRDKGKGKREARREEHLELKEAKIEHRLEKIEHERKEPAAEAVDAKKDERPNAKVAQVENHLTVRPSEAAQAVQHG